MGLSRKWLNVNGIISSFLLLLCPLSAKTPDVSLDESLELRKISEYWKEKDYGTAKAHVKDFLNKYPKSLYSDQLQAMLGDLYFQEKNYPEAAAAYGKVQGKEFRQKTQFHYLHTLYEGGRWDEFIAGAEEFLKHPAAKSEEINTVRFELGEVYFRKAHLPENEKVKKDLMKAALGEYNQLMQTKYGDMTLLQQAQILAFLEDHGKASSLYMMLAHKEQSKKEEYLFQAAASQLHFDKEKAIQTFGAIYDLGGKNSGKAAFNQLNLLFQEKRYRDFILCFDKMKDSISQDKMPLMHYFLGKSQYMAGNHAGAVEPLWQCLASKGIDQTQKRSALFTLVASARETKDLDTLEKALAALKADFPHDEEMGNVILMHAQLCREKKAWGKARADVDELLEIYPDHRQKEALHYDNALLLLEEEKWQESATAFEAFLKAYPKSTHRLSAMRHIVNCRLEDVRRASPETQVLKKEQLLSALKLALEEKKSFSATEMQKIRYLVGKMEFELGKYDEAIERLGEYVADFPKDPSCADAYLLLAYAHQRGERDDVNFALNAEKALAINPRLKAADDLRMTLFNIYLGMAAKAGDGEKGEIIEKAADQLFMTLAKPPKIENLRWLASYYYQQFKSGKKEAAQRACVVLEKLLGTKEGALSITPQTLEKEAEALKLAELYRKTNRPGQYVQILEALSNEYQAHPQFSWKYQRMAQFELGKAYLAAGNREKALETFEHLSASSPQATSYFALAATVEKAKIMFSSEKSEKVCDMLKEVQLKRKLHSEPLHLEAALSYVDCKTQLAPEADRKDRQILLLEKMKENYTAGDDPLVQQYFAASSQFPDQQKLCDQYLAYVELELQRLKGEDAHLIREKFDRLLTQVNEEQLAQRILKSKEAMGL